jgi:hypothetical protein
MWALVSDFFLAEWFSIYEEYSLSWAVQLYLVPNQTSLLLHWDTGNPLYHLKLINRQVCLLIQVCPLLGRLPSRHTSPNLGPAPSSLPPWRVGFHATACLWTWQPVACLRTQQLTPPFSPLVAWAPRLPCVSGLKAGSHVTHVFTTRARARWSGSHIYIPSRQPKTRTMPITPPLPSIESRWRVCTLCDKTKEIGPAEVVRSMPTSAVLTLKGQGTPPFATRFTEPLKLI